LLLSRQPNETTVYEGEAEEAPVKDCLSAACFNERNVYGGYEDGFISSWNLKVSRYYIYI
jgi:hypothetical protein